MRIERDDARLTAYALGELDPSEAAEIEAALEADEALRAEVDDIRSTAAFLADEFAAAAPDAATSSGVRDAIAQAKPAERAGNVVRFPQRAAFVAGTVGLVAAAAAFLVLVTSSSRDAETGPLTTAAPVAGVAPVGGPSAIPDPEEMERLEQLGYVHDPRPILRPRRSPSTSMASHGVGLQQMDWGGEDVGGPGTGGGGGRYEGRPAVPGTYREAREPIGRDSYAPVYEQTFVRAADDSRSTFSIDVDTASYSMMRRFIEQGSIPPADAVRVEEMINYFGYGYPEPEGRHPFSVATEVGSAPWQSDHRLVRIGLRGRTVAMGDRRASNLVFLIDVSGSMADADKLPLLVRGMSMLTQQLDADDRIAIVVYAGASGLVLPPTRGDRTAQIESALERLSAGGSTNGGDGIRLAYSVAAEQFIRGGVNRVILATDGDFNVGLTNHEELIQLVAQRARTGVFLTVLGFGQGNYQDSLLEQLADRGNGNYAYIDSEAEAHRVLVQQGTGTLVTIAKDVKIQVEFDPRIVESFRLVGYDNRVLAHRDFDDDERDAGEIGAGHTVTALYEVALRPGVGHERLATVRLRYKEPEGTVSQLLTVPVVDGGRSHTEASDDFRFAAAVASFGMLLRGSIHSGDTSYAQVAEQVRATIGPDIDGRRAELLRLVQRAQQITRR